MLRSENEIVFPFEKCIIFTVVPFVDYFSHLGRGKKNLYRHFGAEKTVHDPSENGS